MGRRGGRRDRDRAPAFTAHGVLLIDKPKGVTSFDVIRDLRRSTGVRKMGHTGTLDPMATGLLVICLGEATKLVPYLTAEDKSYDAEITLGAATNTYDAEGEVTTRCSREELKRLTQDQISEILLTFLGEQKQRPPSFSAIKVEGKRLYQLARAGEEVEAPIRDVTFHSLTLHSFIPIDTENHLPRISISVSCSKGTYIRSLAHDLGERLGLSAHLSGLRRTHAGDHKLEDAYQLSDVQQASLPDQLTSLVNALPSAPLLHVTSEELNAIKQGKAIPLPVNIPTSSIYRAITPDGLLIALLRPHEGLLYVQRGIHDEGPRSL